MIITTYKYMSSDIYSTLLATMWPLPQPLTPIYPFKHCCHKNTTITPLEWSCDDWPRYFMPLPQLWHLHISHMTTGTALPRPSKIIYPFKHCCHTNTTKTPLEWSCDDWPRYFMPLPRWWHLHISHVTTGTALPRPCKIWPRCHRL